MARTPNPAAHALRRDAFIDVAARLIQTRGYEQLSVEEILSELGASKGAFYHYFDSKEALLEAVVDRVSDAAAAALAPIVDDPGLSAVAKLEALFRGLAQWKNARHDLMLGLLEVWLSDDNTGVREKVRCEVATRFGPLLAVIVRQGEQEGIFTATSPEPTAQVSVSILQGLQEAAARLFLARQKGLATRRDVEEVIFAYTEALERVLGTPPGSLRLVDDDTMRIWFG